MSDLKAACLGREDWPTVSVVMPIRNEAAHLERSVASILEQDYPRTFEVCLGVAPSEDGTEAIAAALAARDHRITVVDNPTGATPAGLNAAIAATGGEVVVRVDGHAALSTGYIKRAVETMRRTGAVNVGGMQVPAPTTPFESAVAAATTSRLGTGGPAYRVGGTEGPVDTVYLGVFDRAAGDRVGWFDESLIRNQDYELNIRLRRAGGTIWFDPALEAAYRPRGSLRALARQYYEYGFWKAIVMRRHPGSVRPRQLAAAAGPVLLTAATLGAPRRPRLLAGPAAYALAICATAGRSTGVPRSAAARLLVVIPIMHWSWSVGFLTGTAMPRSARRRR